MNFLQLLEKGVDHLYELLVDQDPVDCEICLGLKHSPMRLEYRVMLASGAMLRVRLSFTEDMVEQALAFEEIFLNDITRTVNQVI